MFIISRIQTGYGTSTKSWTDINEIFWDLYREQFRILYFEAKEHYLQTSQNQEEVQCFCGGHYQDTNKGKHYKTKKHLKYQTV
jgi:glutathione peroxidase-family protein